MSASGPSGPLVLFKHMHGVCVWGGGGGGGYFVWKEYCKSN